MVDCWGTSTQLLRCWADGLWHPYKMKLHDARHQPVSQLCQPNNINSKSVVSFIKLVYAL